MSKYETLEYEVLLKEDDYEIRKYTNFYIVEYENEEDPEISSGFGSLFKYISSDNKDNEKISMTTPVIQEETRGVRKMAFVAPREFGKDIPEPNNPSIKVKEFEEGVFAVVRYSGFSGNKKELKYQEKLDEWITNLGYKKQSNFMSASYNAPFVPPMFRRNEVWVRINES